MDILTNFVAFQNDKGEGLVYSFSHRCRFLLAQDSDRGEVLCLQERGIGEVVAKALLNATPRFDVSF